MKKIIIPIILLIGLAVITPSFSFAPNRKIPTSARAQKAIERVAPVLKKELDAGRLGFGSPVFIRLFKEEKQLEVWVRDGEGYRLFKVYPVCTYGSGGLGPKTRKGDGKAPEGFYFVTPKSLNPLSNYHLAFNLGYPNSYDQAHGRTGGALMVHGDCVSIGCYAMTDAGIEEVYALADAALRNGQPFFRVHIFPFRMTDANMAYHKESEWYPFWKNLKQGYDFFIENGNVPPDVGVRNGLYVFQAP